MKGVYVQTKRGKQGLKYAIDIWSSVAISRDRIGLEDDNACASATYAVWRSLFKDSERARALYVDILLHDEHRLEVSHFQWDATRDDALFLFEELKRRSAANAFFFYAVDSVEPTRIIEQVLKKTAVHIPEGFYLGLLNHKIIKTPEEARFTNFRALEGSVHYDDATSLQMRHTSHVIRAFLAHDSEMARFQDSFAFKAAPREMGIEIIIDKVHVPQRLLLHELTLSPVWVHAKNLFRMCTRHRSAAEPRQEESGKEEEEDLWPEVLPERVCECAALYVLHIMTQENAAVSVANRQEMTMGRQIALRSMPRNVGFDAVAPEECFGEDEPLDMVLSWVTDDDVDDFEVVVKNVDAATEERLVWKPAEVGMQGL